MAAPRSMLQGVLNPLKGWPDTATLDYVAPFSAAAKVSLDPIPAGRVVHLNESQEFELGCQHTVGKIHMPMFTFHWSDHPDTGPDGGIDGSASSDPDGWMNVSRNHMMGIVAIAGVELETTEFVTGVSYLPGDPLQASSANLGKISKGTLGTHMIVGTCSAGSKKLTQLTTLARDAVAFWPLCIPPQP